MSSAATKLSSIKSKRVDEREDGGRNSNGCRDTSAAERGGDERGGVREREGMWKCW